MRKLARGLLAAALLLLTGSMLVLVAALQGEPSVALQAEPDQNDVARAMTLLRAHDPRHVRAGQVRAAQINERDLDVLLNHAARRWLGAPTHVDLQNGTAQVHASLHLPANPFGRWLNLEARIAETGALPALDSLRIGRLPVPAWVGERLALHALQRLGLRQELELASGMVRRVKFTPEHAVVVYAWEADAPRRMLGALLPPEEQQRLRAYNDHLAKVVADTGPGWTASLAQLVGPMFQFARQRTKAGGDAAAENRAALSTLTLFANGRSAARLALDGATWPRPRPLRLTLNGRDDSPLHFLVSAALAAEGTGPLSRAIGIYKEVADSRGGSGFSFNDLAANRAGIRVGQRAVQQPLQLQALLAREVQESDLMQRVDDLPEFMDEAEFVRRFGGVGAPAYQDLMADIERRVDALPVMR